MPGTLLVATHNAHKTGEMRAILASYFDEVTDLTSVPGMEPPEETGTTFAENSAIKALEASRKRPGVLVLADDSGLEVDALGGAPGVYSSRFSGEGATDASNRTKLLFELSRPEVAAEPRTARFRCVITIARDGEILASFDGAVEGRIASAESGTGGFGYDSLFVPNGHDASFGELSEAIKNGMSHRARALEKFREWLAGD
ncbi:MAG: RdgB/HAM1 family non-canonical purine NTP pyrophosphatase [Verrucomicrobiae bacterium]|nr:RdgB/HAM1 family non-canonical purine NTP pyrophosphatase [Verrucomicrobiae bacterium]